MDLDALVMTATINGSKWSPQITKSRKYKHWVSIKDYRRCEVCHNYNGKIWLLKETPRPEPPVHIRCRCKIENMMAVAAGTATINGADGADWTLKYKKELPEYYITYEDARSAGWKQGKCLSEFAPNKMITRGIYNNYNGHLPSEEGRVWYEADINYENGERNSQRILWSNDGLIFITYDHYETFYEII